MAAYAGLAFLSFLWGSSFLLIKIASRAFDPFNFALARVGVAAAAMLVTSGLSGKIWPGSRPGLWAKLLALALIGQVIPFLLLGKAATLTTSADMALMMGAQPIFVFLFGRFLGSQERWAWLAAFGLALGFVGVAVTSGRRVRKRTPTPSSGGASRWRRASLMEQARSSPAPQRGRSAQSER
jgi:drug/metabolite transporter (DMT)-like permease